MEENQKRNLAVLVVLPVCVLATVLVTRWLIKSNSNSPAVLTEEYNAEEAPVTDDAAAPPSSEETLPKSEQYAGRVRDGENGRPAKPSGRAPAITAENKAEADFLRKHDRELRAYQTYLRRLGLKYRAKYPALRRLDADFGKMDRYMALKRRYETDRNAYNWARGTIALPEVRGKILSASANPEIMKAMIEISLEALRNPPPSSIYNEILRFLSSDKRAAPFVGDMSMKLVGNMTAAIPYAATPGMDLTPLTKLEQQISAGAANAGNR
ncbi:MAG: hypothetical protein WCW52_01040 [Elusimicrobiales bacterium]|jgi:hypothetical protein